MVTVLIGHENRYGGIFLYLSIYIFWRRSGAFVKLLVPRGAPGLRGEVSRHFICGELRQFITSVVLVKPPPSGLHASEREWLNQRYQ